MQFRASLAAVVAAASTLASPAGAVIMVGRAEGTITQGTISPADFPGAGVGSAFVYEFTYDSELGTYHDGDGSYERQYGGPYYGAGNVGPLLSAKVTVGGTSYTLNVPQAYSFVYQDRNGSFYVDYWEQGTSATGVRGDHVYLYVNSSTATRANDTSAGYSFAGICTNCGDFQLTPTASPNQPTSSSSNLRITSLTVSPQAAAAVPEPAAWGLMIGGFMGAGAMLRRRRNLTARAAI